MRKTVNFNTEIGPKTIQRVRLCVFIGSLLLLYEVRYTTMKVHWLIKFCSGGDITAVQETGMYLHTGMWHVAAASCSTSESIN